MMSSLRVCSFSYLAYVSVLKCLLSLLPIKKLEYLFRYYWVLSFLYVFWMQGVYQICSLQIFSPSLWLLVSLTVFSKEQKFQVLANSSLPAFKCKICGCGVKQAKGTKSTLSLTSTEWYMELLHCYIVHLKQIQRCILTTLELK